MKIIIELDTDTLKPLFRFHKFIESMTNEDKAILLRYHGGLLHTGGCEGDYGCCSEYIDFHGLIEDIKDSLSEEERNKNDNS